MFLRGLLEDGKESDMKLGSVIPMVIERGTQGERAYDIYSLLLKERIVVLGSQINDQSANLIVAQLLFLDREDSEQPIQLYVHSPGGEVYAGLAIYDAMQQVTAPVSTAAIGRTASFGTVILTGGKKGLRYALPHSTIHMHQPFGGTQGQVTDMMIMVKEYQRLKEELLSIFMLHTGQPKERLERDMERDIFLNPQEAVEYGLIDSVLNDRKLPASVLPAPK
jgi:ATP-dependent Clp protease, protease subunit